MFPPSTVSGKAAPSRPPSIHSLHWPLPGWCLFFLIYLPPSTGTSQTKTTPGGWAKANVLAPPLLAINALHSFLTTSLSGFFTPFLLFFF